MKRYLLLTLGILCIGLGALGVVIPGLPTTPFLLAASWLLYRSSPRLQKWLLESRLGIYIRDYEKHRGMHRTTKAWVVALMCAMVTSSILFFLPSPLARWIVGICGAIGSFVVIFWVPTAK